MSGKNRFGTSAVFLTAISTILGAIMFLRMGYTVGHVGFLGTLGIILIGHAVTIPTAMAVAEIATNQRVEGGGSYFIISRSFGIVIGASIGVALYLSEAISVAFYAIAFSFAFEPLLNQFGWEEVPRQWISVPAVLILAFLMLTRGADIGVKALYLVVGTLFLALLFFFLGGTDYTPPQGYDAWVAQIDNADAFFLVFAIIFPAFTGVTAGVGLSGDLKEPRKAIPMGTMGAAFAGMAVYVFIAYKLTMSASPETLSSDSLIMSKIAIWGPIIPIGLAAATFSSALGSIMVAPRTLQALGGDAVLPSKALNAWLAQGRGERGEPVHATLVTTAIALGFVLMGELDFVAQIISMFFMVTYGAICLVSFLEHFAADPTYRPSFRSRWYISLFGALMCLVMMFLMQPLYALLAIAIMFTLYAFISRWNPDKKGLARIFQGAIFQVSQRLRTFLQKSRTEIDAETWRPAVICLSKDSFKRMAAFDLLRWLSHRFGFGTYIHYIEGYLSKSTSEQADDAMQRLIKLANVSSSNVYVDTMISPSFTSIIAQLVQLPGISGMENNTVLFEYVKDDPVDLQVVVDNYPLIAAAEFDVCILGSSVRGFGYRHEAHIWITPSDFDNANLMVLLAFVLLGHPEWGKGVIKVFALFPESELERQDEQLKAMIKQGRLPIAPHNVELVPLTGGADKKAIINEKSRDADLTVLGFRGETLKKSGDEVFLGYEGVGNMLFVNTVKGVDIDRSSTSNDAEAGEELVGENTDVEAETPTVVRDKDEAS